GTQRVSSGGAAVGGNVAGTQAVMTGGTASAMNIYGRQNVTGRAYDTVIRKGGTQTIYAGGYAQSTVVSSGGRVSVNGSGKTYKVTVLGGGTQHLSAGAFANATTVSSGGGLIVSSGGSTENVTIKVGGSQILSGGSAVSTTVGIGGALLVSRGGVSMDGQINNTGAQFVYSGGAAQGMTVTSGGSQFVLAGGRATSSIVKAGGTQRVSSGGAAVGGNVAGTQAVVTGGTASAMNMYGRQNVTGRVYDTVIRKGGTQTIYAGGYAQSMVVSSGGRVSVNGSGKTYKVTVLGGGTQHLSAGAFANATTVSSGGVMSLGSGASATSLKILEGGSASVEGGVSLSGTTTVSGGLRVSGTGNTVSDMKTSLSTSISYDVTSVNVADTMYMLSSSMERTFSGRDFSISVSAEQQAGVYELSSGFIMTSGTEFSIILDGRSVGEAVLNGGAFHYGGRSYAVTSDNEDRVQLTVSESTSRMATFTRTDEVNVASYASATQERTNTASADGMPPLFDTGEAGTAFAAGTDCTVKELSGQNILFTDTSTIRAVFGCADTLMPTENAAGLGDTRSRTGVLASV
uniref:AIDA repeat-containing protein n=1 Tax=Mailhella massiliensis TaxID=1903261 RepID=UPI00235609C1